MEQKQLIFKLGEESIPTVMSHEDLNASPFADAIHGAKDRILKMMEQISKSTDNQPDSRRWIDSTPNNIIAFFGDRGAGKTSCMRTLLNELKEIQKKKQNKEWLFEEEIDPSFFDEKHNVLEILIGTLYGDFKKNCEGIKQKPLSEQDQLKTIQEDFLKVKSALRYLPNTPDLNDRYEIDALHHLNEGGKIRMLLKDLIDKILKYKGNRYLVVPIDDLDLNIKQSYMMMEHIRKYLILPNVIVIIAAKYTQLFDSICRDLTSVYSGLEYRVSHKDIAEMAERYLNKIFPLDQRFEMPAVDTYMDAELKILDEENHILYEKEDVKLTVPSIIFERTRYLFYNSSGMPSLVIPRNLRDLRMLVSLLVKMKPYSEETHAQNKRVFKDYFFNEWLGVLESEYRRFAKSLLEEENLAKINRVVVRNLYDFFLSKIETYEQIRQDIEKAKEQKRSSSVLRERELLLDILNPSNSYWNVSIGDVVFILNAVRKSYDSPNVLAVIFFIESFYSIKLYETYDRLTSMTDKSGLYLPIEKNTTAPELKTSVRGDMPEYFRLVGGGFFAPSRDYFTPLSTSGDPQSSREYNSINGKLLIETIRKVERQYQELFQDAVDENVVEIPASLTETLRLCEFFMLTVKFRQDARSFGLAYRLANEPLSFKEFGPTSRHLVFDLTLPFLHAIYPEFAYNRFGRRLYEFAKKDKNSLLSRMTEHKNRNKPNDTWELMSKAAIRNMEILEDLTAWLHKNREDGKLSGANIMKIFQAFYYQFLIEEDASKISDFVVPKGKYGVKTYGKISENSQKPYYHIDYSIYSELAKVVSEIESADSKTLPKLRVPVSNVSNEISSESDNIIEIIIDEDSSKKEDDLKVNREELKAIFNGIFAYNAIFISKRRYHYEEVADTLIPYCGPLSVELYLGSEKNTVFSIQDLAQILAEIRIEDRYDFDGKLPSGLNFAYNQLVEATYHNKTQPIEINKANLESKLAKLNAEQSSILDYNKKLRQEISQYEKDYQKGEDELISIQSEAKQHKDFLDYIQDRLAEKELEKTEYNKLRKEEEKSLKLVLSFNAKLEEISKRISLYKSRITTAQSTIRKNETRIEEMKTQRVSTEAELKKQTSELDRINFSYRHPRSLEIRF